MALPGVSMTVRDGGLALVPAGAGSLFAKIGPSPLGYVNTVFSIADQTTLIKTLGNGGALVEAAALALAVGGQGPVRPTGLLLVPVNPSTYGTASAVAHGGTGSGTVSVAVKSPNAFQIKCVLAGAAGVAQFQTSVDGGITYGPTWTSAATLIIPGAPFTTLAFGAGTAVVGDLITVSTSGTVTQVSGTGTLAVTFSAACPVDAYTVVITITTGGALGVAMFTYSLDGGTTTSAPTLVPAGGSIALADTNDPNKAGQCSTGLFVTFASTFVAGDTYSFTSTSASYSSSDMTSAFNALAADTRFSSGVGLHVVGPAASSSAAAALAATLDVLMGNAAGSFKFNRAMIENPTDTDANILSAYAATSTTRTGAAPGFHTLISVINARQQSRPAAWSVMARAGCVPPAEDLGRVATGSLPGVVKLARDESVTPGLDAGRLTTLTSIPGRNGFWVTNARLLTNPGSDFTFWQYGRVIDLVSFYGRLGLLTFLNDNVRVNNDGTGSIAEKDARKIEQFTDGFIRNAVPPGSFVDLFVSISRTNNVLSSQTILPSIRVLPNGVAKFINADVGFTSQGLQVKAA